MPIFEQCDEAGTSNAPNGQKRTLLTNIKATIDSTYDTMIQYDMIRYDMIYTIFG